MVALLDWCAEQRAVAIPYGGGSSVVGGVEPPPDCQRPVVSIDLRRLDRVIEVDAASRAARIQAGVYGPALEDQLRPHGYTLRHFPQSFEFSSLGGGALLLRLHASALTLPSPTLNKRVGEGRIAERSLRS